MPDMEGQGLIRVALLVRIHQVLTNYDRAQYADGDDDEDKIRPRRLLLD